MSNPAVFLLAEADINGNHIRIEDNLGEAVHIHVGMMRFELTTDEFLEFTKSVESAMNNLFQYSGISLKLIDNDSFDWPWAYNYRAITDIKLVNVKLCDLYTRAFYFNRPEFSHIVSLAKSPLLQKEIPGFLDEYNAANISNSDRNLRINEIIEEKGYPFSDKHILINQLNQIYDGEHRAVALFKKFGKDYEIPCVQIVFSNLTSINQQKYNDLKGLIKYLIRNRASVALNLRKKFKLKKFLPTDITSLEDEILNETVFEICRPVYLRKEKVADSLVIVKEGSIQKLKRYQDGEIEFPYTGYRMLYSMEEPLLFVKERKLIAEVLFTTSFFENALLPLDKKINEYALSNKVSGFCENRKEVDGMTEFVFVITDCILNRRFFSYTDIELLTRRGLWDEKTVNDLLRRVFFNYTDTLLEHLKNERFDLAISDFITNTKY